MSERSGLITSDRLTLPGPECRPGPEHLDQQDIKVVRQLPAVRHTRSGHIAR